MKRPSSLAEKVLQHRQVKHKRIVVRREVAPEYAAPETGKEFCISMFVSPWLQTRNKHTGHIKCGMALHVPKAMGYQHSQISVLVCENAERTKCSLYAT